MVDGDQLNVVVEPIIVSVAERNIREFNIVPLFYDANKAAAEIVTKASIFNGLKRAHLFSNIGEISNMLTRLWNRENPDIEAAALLTYLNNLRIDGAKTGAVNEYTNYPAVAKKINKATGGSKGRMPWFFQFSKNGRSSGKKPEQYAKETSSTMNRICKSFNDIGNIVMNYAEVPPLNYEMFLSERPKKIDKDVIDMFCYLDGLSISEEIESTPTEIETKGMYDILSEIIEEELIDKFGSLDKCYSHIVIALFAGENWRKSSHKRMFWRVFGERAIQNLQDNIKNNTTCEYCGAKIPIWDKDGKYHYCPRNTEGFYVCIECGKQVRRKGPKECRCDDCQKQSRKSYNIESAYRSRQTNKEKALNHKEEAMSRLNIKVDGKKVKL